MAVPLARLPRYLVLEPTSSVRFEVVVSAPTWELDVELGSPRPGRSFLLSIGPQGGPVVRRLRLSGRARIFFEPEDERNHLLLLANPQREPIVLRLRGRNRSKPEARALVRTPSSRVARRSPAAVGRRRPPAPHDAPADAAA